MSSKTLFTRYNLQTTFRDVKLRPNHNYNRLQQYIYLWIY